MEEQGLAAYHAGGARSRGWMQVRQSNALLWRGARASRGQIRPRGSGQEQSQCSDRLQARKPCPKVPVGSGIKRHEPGRWHGCWVSAPRLKQGQEGQPLLKSSSAGKEGSPGFWLLTSSEGNLWLNTFTHPTEGLNSAHWTCRREDLVSVLTEWAGRKWHVSVTSSKSSFDFS